MALNASTKDWGSVVPDARIRHAPRVEFRARPTDFRRTVSEFTNWRDFRRGASEFGPDSTCGFQVEAAEQMPFDRANTGAGDVTLFRNKN